MTQHNPQHQQQNHLSYTIKIAPQDDGVTHVNIGFGKYIQTSLGNELSNFYEDQLYHPIDGMFNTIEGYWHWQRNGASDTLQPDDSGRMLGLMRLMRGLDAKTFNKSIQAYNTKNGIIDSWKPSFYHGIRVMVLTKLLTKEGLLDRLIENHLPLMHYFMFGGVIQQPRSKMDIAELYTELRTMAIRGGRKALETDLAKHTNLLVSKRRDEHKAAEATAAVKEISMEELPVSSGESLIEATRPNNGVLDKAEYNEGGYSLPILPGVTAEVTEEQAAAIHDRLNDHMAALAESQTQLGVEFEPAIGDNLPAIYEDVSTTVVPMTATPIGHEALIYEPDPALAALANSALR